MCRHEHELCQRDLRGLSKYEVNQHYFDFIRNATKKEYEEHDWNSRNTRGLYKCKICGKEHLYRKTSFNTELKICENNCNGFGSGRGVVVVGFNNLAITDSSKIETLINKDDGYKFSRKSHASLFIKCPSCGKERKTTVANLIRSNGKCKSCSAKERHDNMTEQERKELSAKLSKATKQYMSNLTEEELAKRVDKRAKTMASKTEEEKREIGRKCSEGAKSFWINLTDEEMDKIREQRANLLYERWNNMTDEDKKYFSEHMSEVQLAKTGGVTEITTYFRNSSFVQEWKDKARKEANYICNITNKQGKLPVHHLYGFNLIIRDAHIVNSIEIKKTIGEYSKEELYKLEEYVESWHKDSSNAVVLSEEIHILFHSCKDKDGNVLYGYGNNTPEQFEEFKERYLNGEFKDLLGDDLND